MTDSKPPRPAASISADDAILILEEADLASSASVPLAPGLRAMAAEAWSGRFRRTLHELADRLDAGEPLPSVLESLRPSLSPVMEALLEEGTDCGRMDLILHWSAEQSRRRSNLRRQLWTALAYPFCLMGIAGAITIFFLTAIAPQFNSIYRDFGTQLPGMTQVVLWISGFVTDYWVWEAFAAGVLTSLAIVAFFGSDWCSRQRWWGNIPLIGPLFRLVALADFCQFLAILIEIRSPLPKAVRLAGRASGDKWLMACGEDLASLIESGQFSAATASELRLPQAIGQMLHGIADPDSLAEALYGLAEIYSARAEVNSRFIAVIVEPLVMTIIIVGLGTVVISLFIPLIKLLNDLS